jgi:hypothetical protein
VVEPTAHIGSAQPASKANPADFTSANTAPGTEDEVALLAGQA